MADIVEKEIYELGFSIDADKPQVAIRDIIREVDKLSGKLLNAQSTLTNLGKYDNNTFVNQMSQMVKLKSDLVKLSKSGFDPIAIAQQLGANYEKVLTTLGSMDSLVKVLNTEIKKHSGVLKTEVDLTEKLNIIGKARLGTETTAIKNQRNRVELLIKELSNLEGIAEHAGKATLVNNKAVELQKAKVKLDDLEYNNKVKLLKTSEGINTKLAESIVLNSMDSKQLNDRVTRTKTLLEAEDKRISSMKLQGASEDDINKRLAKRNELEASYKTALGAKQIAQEKADDKDLKAKEQIALKNDKYNMSLIDTNALLKLSGKELNDNVKKYTAKYNAIDKEIDKATKQGKAESIILDLMKRRDEVEVQLTRAIGAKQIAQEKADKLDKSSYAASERYYKLSEQYSKMDASYLSTSIGQKDALYKKAVLNLELLKMEGASKADIKKAEGAILTAKQNFNIAQAKSNDLQSEYTANSKLAQIHQEKYLNTSSEALSTRIGKLKLEAQTQIQVVRELKAQGAATEVIAEATGKLRAQLKAVDIERVKNIKTQQLMQERETTYNAMLTAHAAKRAVGYSLLYSSIFAVSAAFTSGVQSLIEYDKALYTMQAVLDITPQKAKVLEDNMHGLSVQYGEQLSSLNNVALALGRAGVKYDDLAEGTKRVTQLAILTGDSIEASTSAIVSYVQVFGKNEFGEAISTVGELSAKLAYLANASKLSTVDINTFSNYALSTAKAVGMTIDQVNALAASLSNSGKAATTIGTSIRRFSEMLGDTNPKIQSFFQSIGVNQANLQKDIAKGGAESNKAFLGFIDQLSKFSKESINVSLNGADTLMRDTVLSIANVTEEIKKNFQGSLEVTAKEIDKADIVTATFERRIASLGNTIKGAFHEAQPAIGSLATGLEFVVKNYEVLGTAIGAYVLISQRATIAQAAHTASLTASTVATNVQAAATSISTLAAHAYSRAMGIATVATATEAATVSAATGATKAFTTALLANPLILGAAVVAAGIVGVTMAFNSYGKSVDTSAEATKGLSAASIEALKNINNLSESARKAEEAAIRRRDAASKDDAKNKKIELDEAKIKENLATIEKYKLKVQDQGLNETVRNTFAAAVQKLTDDNNKLKDKIKELGGTVSNTVEKTRKELQELYKTFTETDLTRFTEGINLADTLIDNKSTKSIGEQLMKSVLESATNTSKEVIPKLIADINDSGIAKAWGALGTKSGEAFYTGISSLQADVYNIIANLEAQLKNFTGVLTDSAKKDKDDIETRINGYKALYSVLESSSKVGASATKKQVQNSESAAKKLSEIIELQNRLAIAQAKNQGFALSDIDMAEKLYQYQIKRTLGS